MRRANLRRAERATQQRPPAVLGSVAARGVPTTFGAPRTLLFVTVKRDNTSWREMYGHWWLEVDGDGAAEAASYGWWPAAVPLRVRDLLLGCPGVLNGMGLLGRPGGWDVDALHGDEPMHAFHPVLGVEKPDEQVRDEIRRFAHSYRGRWRWHVSARRASGTCRAFQDELFAAVGLHEPREQLHTRGSGCPFLYQPRRVWWDLLDTVAPGIDRRAQAG
jgi:hypothetical protein